MASRKTLRSEIDDLRATLDTLQNERSEQTKAPRAQPAQPKTANKKHQNTAKDTITSETEKTSFEGIGDIETALKDLADLSEKELTKHPLMALGLVFLLGLLVGRRSQT